MSNALHHVSPWPARVGAVWYRHMRVYTKTLFSNALPPFLEPLIFLAGIGFGLGAFVPTMGGTPYVTFLAAGILVTSSMYTAAFEMSYGTYIRMVFDKVYDGMLGAPVSADDLMFGEILWCGTKGAVFSFSVLLVCLISGALAPGWILLAPVVGFLTGLMFAVLSLLITTIVDNLDNFNFYFTGLLSPMFFFSGVVFPLESLPRFLLPVAEALPLTHCVRLVRGFLGGLEFVHLWDLAYCLAFIALVGGAAIRRIKRRLID
jgi:lipooligosaccharide transport system permease protein